MADTAQKIAEIREALKKATPGPWAVFVGEGWTEEYPRNTYVQAVWNEPDHRGSFGYRVARMAGVHGRTMADAHLIANAPEWLGFLLEERDKLIEVLRWYADAVNYEYRTSYLDQDAPIIDDSGQRARDILHEIGVTVE